MSAAADAEKSSSPATKLAAARAKPIICLLPGADPVRLCFLAGSVRTRGVPCQQEQQPRLSLPRRLPSEKEPPKEAGHTNEEGEFRDPEVKREAARVASPVNDVPPTLDASGLAG